MQSVNLAIMMVCLSSFAGHCAEGAKHSSVIPEWIEGDWLLIYSQPTDAPYSIDLAAALRIGQGESTYTRHYYAKLTVQVVIDELGEIELHREDGTREVVDLEHSSEGFLLLRSSEGLESRYLRPQKDFVRFGTTEEFPAMPYSYDGEWLVEFSAGFSVNGRRAQMLVSKHNVLWLEFNLNTQKPMGPGRLAYFHTEDERTTDLYIMNDDGSYEHLIVDPHKGARFMLLDENGIAATVRPLPARSKKQVRRDDAKSPAEVVKVLLLALGLFVAVVLVLSFALTGAGISPVGSFDWPREPQARLSADEEAARDMDRMWQEQYNRQCDEQNRRGH